MTTAPIFEGVADVEAPAQRMRAFHLPGINAELAHIAGITACAQPLLHRVINITLVAIQTR